MRPEQLEAWVLSIVDLVRAGRRVEDDRIELKADWPSCAAAARRVAGHANASGGGSVLWIIGLDEKRGLVPFGPQDPATWIEQLARQFDGISPSVQMLSVPTADTAVYALLFDTTRRPFVVKNPAHGITPGDAVAFEVPWREGTRVRTARREDLIRLLVPATQQPTFEVLEADAAATRMPPSKHGYKDPTLAWSVSLDLYVSPRTPDRLVLPVRKAALEFQPEGGTSISMGVTGIRPPYWGVGTGGMHIDSHTIIATSSEAIVTGPGRLIISAGYAAEDVELTADPPAAEVRVRLLADGNDRQMLISASLLPLAAATDADNRISRWTWNLTGIAKPNDGY